MRDGAAWGKEIFPGGAVFLIQNKYMKKKIPC